MGTDDSTREKNWKHLYIRSNKLHRAKQLGIEYPRENERELVERESLHILFVCSMNQWRSPTAEKIYADRLLVIARSRGTSRKAKLAINSTDLQWADVIFVMEDKHAERLLSDFPSEMRYKEIYVLDIPNIYKFMDPELVTEIQSAVDPILNRQILARSTSK